MCQFFRRLAHKTGVLHAPSDPARSPTRPLRVLLVAAMVLPVTLYAVAAAISYRDHFADSRDRLRRNCDPSSADYCLERADFHHLQTLTVCEGWC